MKEKQNTKTVINYTLNTVIFILVFIIAYFIFSIISSNKKQETSFKIIEPKDTVINYNADTSETGVITVEVLNGSGESKLAAKVTEFLRKHGNIDVKRYDNFRTDNVPETLVQSRNGDFKKALVISELIGIPERKVNIVKSDDIESEVRIIIGKDYKKLKIDFSK